MLACILAACLVAPAPDNLSPGTQLVYQGKFYADRGDAGNLDKTFELSVFVAAGEQGRAVYWSLDERGFGGWTWLDRFGKVLVDERLRQAGGGTPPTLRYQRSEGTSVVPVLLPFFSSVQPLAEGAAWTDDRLEYQVAGTEKVGARDAWRVEVRSSIGRKRSLWIDRASPIVLAVHETVFVGQGESHTLRYELMNQSTWNDSQATKLLSVFNDLLRLRERLEIEPQSRELAWTPERLKLLKAELPDLIARAKDTPLAKLADAAEQQSRAEKNRSSAIGAMEGRLVGNVTPRPELETVAGAKFAWDDLQGKVTVLHFWEYRDMPLEEPYGQVAYLDFLHRKHGGKEMQVFGVVADERVAQLDTRRSGIQSARRLHSFMNLSYPLLVDVLGGVKQFGDPRVTGSRLPLFVVIDRAGKVVHYHAGHYEVNRDRGLEELELVIRKALDNRG